MGHRSRRSAGVPACHCHASAAAVSAATGQAAVGQGTGTRRAPVIIFPPRFSFVFLTLCLSFALEEGTIDQRTAAEYARSNYATVVSSF